MLTKTPPPEAELRSSECARQIIAASKSSLAANNGLFVAKSSARIAPIVAGLWLMSGQGNVYASTPDFAREVEPILAKNCFSCHGPEKQKSGYRLDIREIAFKGGDSGKTAIVPHDAKNSPLIRFVSGEDEEIFMPPKKSNVSPLNRDEVMTLRAWVDAGAVWPEALAGAKGDGKPLWSLRRLEKVTVPAKTKNPIDAFIRTKLA